ILPALSPSQGPPPRRVLLGPCGGGFAGWDMGRKRLADGSHSRHMLPAPRRGGGAAGLCPAAGPLPSLARQRARSSQRSLCVAAKAASFNSLAHWASASLFPPLAALGSAPGVSAPTFLLPMRNRRNAGGGALA